MDPLVSLSADDVGRLVDTYIDEMNATYPEHIQARGKYIESIDSIHAHRLHRGRSHQGEEDVVLNFNFALPPSFDANNESPIK